MASDSKLEVVRGNPSPEELAALMVALVVRAAQHQLGQEVPADPPPATSEWAERTRPGRPGQEARGSAWRLSGWAR
ncbi:acyl-CoA carboxylase subunit epsilon [Sphaerisporangium sp. NPDC051017]|uniref:acyl-CoA carboxylase subunit epsilon n=1 Tax=Sphaerisporangium sp. NPDC051017 TaxID=3154636 RepID=UPI003426D617